MEQSLETPPETPLEALLAGLDDIRRSPQDGGRLELIVRRPGRVYAKYSKRVNSTTPTGSRATPGTSGGRAAALMAVRIPTCNSTS